MFNAGQLAEIMELQKLAGMENFKKLTIPQYLEREKLIELLKDGGVRDFPFVAALADNLIANGVTISVRCKDCDWYRKHEGGICVNPKCVKSWYGCPVPAEHFCSYGERREGE